MLVLHNENDFQTFSPLFYAFIVVISKYKSGEKLTINFLIFSEM